MQPIWHRLAARATLLGRGPPAPAATTDDPRLRIVPCEDGGTPAISPVSAAAGCYTFVLPSLDGPVRLVSLAARPCDARPWVEDRRRLGVMVSRLILRVGSGTEPIPLDHPRLSQGWHKVERDRAALWRSTTATR